MEIPFTVEIQQNKYDCFRVVEKMDSRTCMQEIIVKGIGSEKDDTTYYYEDAHLQEIMQSWASILAKRIIARRLGIDTAA